MSDLDAMLNRRPESCLSDLMLDRWLAGELADTSEAETVQGHLDTCDACTVRVAEIQAEAEAFPNDIWVSGEAARTRKASRQQWVRPAIAAVAAIAAIVLVVQITPPPDTRTKGGDQLQIFARTGSSGQVSEVLPGQILSPNDAIRFQLSTRSDGHLVIVGIDEAGAVTPYVPADGGEPVFLPRGKNQLTEGSIILDDTLGAERVIAFVCVNPVTVEDIRAASFRALEAAGGDPRRIEEVGVGCRETSVIFEKQR